MSDQPILSVRHLNTDFVSPDGKVAHALEDVSFDVCPGQTIGLVGESGCGKTTTLMSVMRLLPSNGRITQGSIMFKNQNLLNLSERQMRSYRWKEMSIIFQGAMNALNPVMQVGDQICEPILLHNLMEPDEADARVDELLDLVGIPHSRRNQYPHQYSGGMRQRAMIAIALACRPKVLLADEPTTALDVTIQDQIIRLVQGLQDELGMGVVWVTHDLGVVAQLCDRVAVMYAGQIMESADAIELFENSRHPYTHGLLESIPKGGSRQGQLVPIPGQPPNLLNLPPGCPFAPRCRYATDECSRGRVPLREVSPGHHSACIRFEEIWN